ATVVTVVGAIFLVQGLARQPILITSLASSAFLFYYQPLNEVNRFAPLVFGHLLAAGVGFLAALFLPVPYASTAVSIAGTVVLLMVLRLVHPPAISTSLVFSYQPHGVPALLTFALVLFIIAVLGLLYVLLRIGIQPSRWAHFFGLTSEENEDHRDDR
ncbi:MAG: HPP family protein, partial [Chloroflexota bacterium]